VIQLVSTGGILSDMPVADHISISSYLSTLLNDLLNFGDNAMIMVEKIENDEDGEEKVLGVRRGAIAIRLDSIYTDLGRSTKPQSVL